MLGSRILRKVWHLFLKMIGRGKRYEKVTSMEISEAKILADMEKKKEILEKKGLSVIDLRDQYWFEHADELWQKLQNTFQVVVPEKLRDWIIGQDEALHKLELMVHEFIHKLKNKIELEKVETKLSPILEEKPGPYALLVGDPGVGKSMAIKVLAERLPFLYKEQRIDRYMHDVMVVENKSYKFHPLVRYVPAGLGKRIQRVAQWRETKKAWKNKALFYGLVGTLALLGILILSIALGLLINNLLAGYSFLESFLGLVLLFTGGATLLGFAILILVFFIILPVRRFQPTEETEEIPHLIVDNDPNDPKTKFYVDATGHSAAQLFGDILWDPYQTGGLGTPPHRRVVAGDVHRADFKILYMDEIKNMQIWEAVEFLSILEDESAPIKSHGGVVGSHGGSTAALNVVTDPIRTVFFFIAAGNLDVLYDPNSILNRLPPFRDRIENYGDFVYMKNEMDAIPQNEVKVLQFITDEIYRFNLPPMEKEGVREIIKYMRRKASSKYKMRIMFRYVIKVIKKSAQLCWEDGSDVIKRKHVKEAIEEHCKEIEQQALEQALEEQRLYKLIKIEGEEIGTINALGVVSKITKEGIATAGTVNPISVRLKLVDDPKKAAFIVTGITPEEGTWIDKSKQMVRTVILMLYGIDMAKECYVHVDFVQSLGIDGPSAGAAMAIGIMSWLGDPDDKRPIKERVKDPIPLRQDVAITGAIEIKAEYPDDFPVSSIGGTYDKILGAIREGIANVIIPEKNYQHSIDPGYFKDKIVKGKNKPVEIFHKETLRQYFEIVRADKKKEAGEGLE